MVFLFHSWYVMLGLVRNMKIFCSEDLFWFQSYWSRDILHGNFRLVFGNYIDVIQTLFTNLTPLVSHMLNGLFTNCDIWRVSSYLCKSWRVPHVGQEMLTLSGTSDCIHFGVFMISPIHYIYIIYYSNCQFWDYVYGLMTGLFAWIRLTAFVSDLFDFSLLWFWLSSSPLYSAPSNIRPPSY